MSSSEKIYKLLKEKDDRYIVDIYKRQVMPVSGGIILRTSEESITVSVCDGDAIMIGSYIYVWRARKKYFEPQI